MLAARMSLREMSMRFGKSETIIKEMLEGKRKTDEHYLVTLREIIKNVR